MKVCSICQIEKDINEYNKHNETKDGYYSYCKSCKANKQREYRQKTSNICTFKYEKTERGYIMRCYRNMKSRVTGILKNKAHLYSGKDILSKEEFYKWSLSNNDFNSLLTAYSESGYKHGLAPAIDRINSDLGYVIGNIRWITHSENSRLGTISRFKKVA